MAKAALAPQTTYNRSFWISTKALQSFKDIIERYRLSKYISRTQDHDLANILDYALSEATAAGKQQAFCDREGPFWAVDISETLEASVVALLRKSTNNSPGVPEKTAVILLDREYADKRQKMGYWKPVVAGQPAPAFNGTMATKLADVKIPAQVVAPAPVTPATVAVQAPVARPAPATIPHPLPVTAAPVTPVAQTMETYLVRWKNVGMEAFTYAEYPKTDAANLVSNLGNDRRVDAQSIEIWKRVKAKVQVQIDD